MKVSVRTKGDFKETIDFLKRTPRKAPRKAFSNIGQQGVNALMGSTPVDTGQTARSWDYDIVSHRNEHEIVWYNYAHPHTRVPVAMLIYTGHGTKNGGYVAPYDYITPAMNRVFKDASDKIVEEMLNG